MNELESYFADCLDPADLPEAIRFPLPDEPFVECWLSWAAEADEVGAAEVLRRYLPQLNFAIAEGMSQRESYRRATLRGESPELIEDATGLDFVRPESVRLVIHQSLAGRIPVLEVSDRETFVQLLRALAKRNEPVPVSDAVGAQMIAGYNNWHRIALHRSAYYEQEVAERHHETWKEAFAAIRSDRSLYQDLFILLSEGPYSAVPADALDLDEKTWRDLSLVLRREHECTHYFTRRLFGAMRNHLLDELLCDYAGIVSARGSYSAAWFLRFMGLDDLPQVRPEGRIHAYRGDPPLSDDAFDTLKEVVHDAAHQLERFDRRLGAGERSARRRALHLAAIATQRLDHIATPDGAETLERAVAALDRRIARPDA